jgi:hypothetical protein
MIAVTEKQAVGLLKNWAEEVRVGGNLREVFSDEQGALMTNIALDKEAVLCLLSYVGVAHFRVYFGLNEAKKFVLVVWGEDDKNRRLTDFFVCERAGFQRFEKVYFEHQPLLPHSISEVLGKPWLEAWANLVAVHEDIFKLYGEVLRGYTMAEKVLRDALTAQGKEVHFCFTYHTHAQRSDAGTFGLMLLGANETPESGLFQDRLHPCPYTCSPLAKKLLG